MNKEDIFTSIRNILENEINDSRVTLKEKDEPDQSKIPDPSKLRESDEDKN